MTRLTTFGTAVALGLLATAGTARAVEPIGDWQVEDGSAHIRIANCAGDLWGIVSWEKDPGGVDSDNPDPAKRTRPTLGMPILLAMKPVNPKKWGGEVYNAKNGKTYKASIETVSDTMLKIEGCVLGGIFCGGEKWTRVVAKAPTPPPAPSSVSASVCPRLTDVPGFTHQGRLK